MKIFTGKPLEQHGTSSVAEDLFQLSNILEALSRRYPALLYQLMLCTEFKQKRSKDQGNVIFRDYEISHHSKGSKITTVLCKITTTILRGKYF